MKVSELKFVQLTVMIFVPSIESADSGTGVRSTKELHDWVKKFLIKFGDADLLLEPGKSMEIDVKSNAKYKKWQEDYYDDKGKFIRDVGHTN
jgi:hypothetical protein